jgi:sorting nexin-7/30
MDDPLSRALRGEDDEELNYNENGQTSLPDPIDSDLNEQTSSLSISHSHNEWILPSINERKEEVEINREQTKVYVCDPKKHKSYNDGVKINEFNVRRRYNDFIWLKNLLDIKYPFNIISPLPVKHTLSKKLHVVADDGDFIRRRMIGKKKKL